MKRAIFLFAFCLLFSSILFAKTLPSVFYEVSPILQNNEAKLRIKLSFKGDKSGKEKVSVPQFKLKEKLSNEEKKACLNTAGK